MPPNKKRNKQEEKAKEWKNSKAKNELEKALLNGEIPLTSEEMKPCIAYLQNPEFTKFEYKRFCSNLRALRNQISLKMEAAHSDSAALAHDRLIFLTSSHNHRGELRWEGSAAQELLKVDMKEGGSYFELTKKKLYASRKEYYEQFSESTFINHVRQEERRIKFVRQYGSKLN